MKRIGEINMTKNEVIQILKDCYEKLSKTDISACSMLEAAKVIDLYADIENVIKYLETGEE